MREIKFRGKAEDTKEWVYGDLFHDKDCFGHIQYSWIYEYDNNHGRQFQREIDGRTIGQFTGLKDKNDVEIYEGDILEMENFNPKNMEVKFIEGAFCLNTKDNLYSTDIHYIHHAGHPQSKVIGNIHDNPKLLKGD